MTTPPSNRRPGIDADIIQGQFVRGYDVPAGDMTAPPPCDLVVSNGLSNVDQSVSNLVFANRTDDLGQPMFIMRRGVDTAPLADVHFYVGDVADPNGSLAGTPPGSLYTSYGTPALWQVQLDGTTWVKISDDLGGENLAETLAIGNTTGGTDIVVSSGDVIRGETTVQVVGGANTVPGGSGGNVFLVGGSTVGGKTGGIQLETPDGVSSNASGSIVLTTGSSPLGGIVGGVEIRTGDAGAAGVIGTSGAIDIKAGESLTTGALGVGGTVDVRSGDATSDGQGGDLFLVAGSGGTPVSVVPSPSAAGAGGDALLAAGNSSGTEVGGNLILRGGVGGSGGGVGGGIALIPGAGGGGADDGEVTVFGILESANILHRDGDPNVVGVPGDEGDIYQRTDTGLGQLWVNTNGSSTGWVRLAAAGDFIESFQQLQSGTLTPSGATFGGADEENFSDTGIFKGLRAQIVGGGISVLSNDSGPALTFTINESVAGQRSGVDLVTSASFSEAATLNQRFFSTFVFNTGSTNTNVTRYFVGLSDNSLATQLSADLPLAGNYIGFMRSGTNANWLVVHRGPTGQNFINTGVAKTTVDAAGGAYFFIIDATDFVTSSVVRCLILDDTLTLVSSITVPVDLPLGTAELGPVIGLEVPAGPNPLGFSSISLNSATLTTNADLAGQVGGSSSGSLSLAQVLVNGNDTGASVINVNQGSGILGVTDDNAGAGADVSVLSGFTTAAAQRTGNLLLASAQGQVGNVTAAGIATGSAQLRSGNQEDPVSQGNTGGVEITSGDHAGTDGETGDLVLRTGGFTLGGGGTGTVQGDILIGPGSFLPNVATTTGRVFIQGGSTTLPGVDGGDVQIVSGLNSSASGNSGDLTLNSFNVNQAGTSGDVILASGEGGTTGTSGPLTLRTGDAPGGATGALTINTGAAGNGSAGGILMIAGSSSSGNGSDISIAGGFTPDPGGTGGNIALTPGTGGAGDGAVIINGKLTVTGLIDPTGLVLTGQAAAPTTLAAGEGLIWVDNNASPSELVFTNDLGTDIVISTAAGATTLGGLTDVTLTGPVAGQVLTYNGAQWINLASPGGASPLADVLLIGNTTGATNIVVSGSAGATILSDDDLVLSPDAAAGKQVVIDGLRWPEADGLANEVLMTDGAGNLTFGPGGGGGGDLATVLTAGNKTGGTAISGDDVFNGNGGDLTLKGGNSTGGAGVGFGGDVVIDGGTPNPAVAGGSGGNITLTGAPANNSGSGGTVSLIGGAGAGGGPGGSLVFSAGSAVGTGDGGGINLTPGSGAGGGTDGEVSITGDLSVTGKLTVTGMIDPPGLLLSDSPSVPFTPTGMDGGIWVDSSGDLIYTNATIGDLNIVDTILGGVGFLDALLTSGSGFLGAGNPTSIQPRAYGVYGSSSTFYVDPGPPAASLTFGEDSEGPFLNLALAALACSECYVAAEDRFVQTDQRFKARFKFQIGSAINHLDERIFIGFTSDSTAGTATAQLDADHGAITGQYIGLMQNQNDEELIFVAQGSGGAMVAVVALASTDSNVYYFEVDVSAASGEATFTLLADDATTVVATHTEPSSNLLPDTTQVLRPFTGLKNPGGSTPHSIDFYHTSIVTRADVVAQVTLGGVVPTLSQVLATGNESGSNEIILQDSGGITGTIRGEDSAVSNGLRVLIVAGSATNAGGADNGGNLSLVGGEAFGSGDGGEARLVGGVSNGGNGGGARVTGGEANGTGSGGDVVLFGGAGGPDPGALPGGNVLIESGPTMGTGDSGHIAITGPGLSASFPWVAGSVNIVGGDNAAGSVGGLLLAGPAGVADGGNATVQGGAAGGGSNHEGGPGLLSGGQGDGTGNGGEAVVQGGVAGADAAASGGDVRIQTGVGNVAGGNAGNLTLQGSDAGGTGNGGDVTIRSGASIGGGDGGTIILQGPNVTFPVPPLNGAIYAVAGYNAAGSTGGTFVAGAAGATDGGDVTIAGGFGAATSGDAGGDATLVGGNGDGAADGGVAEIRGGTSTGTGAGGDARVISAAGSGAGGDSGNVVVQGSDAGGTGAGGDVLVKSGNSVGGTVSGLISLQGGNANGVPVHGTAGALTRSATGGDTLIQSAGLAPTEATGSFALLGASGTNGLGATKGGSAWVSAGAAEVGSNGDGGDLFISSGQADGNGVAGGIVISGAPSNNSGVNQAGDVTIKGGDLPVTGNRSTVTIQGGNATGGTGGVGGEVRILGGNGDTGAGAQNGGDVVLTGGDGGLGGVGGDVRLTAGAAGASSGEIYLNSPINVDGPVRDNGSGFQFGVVDLGAVPALTATISFNVPFSSAPSLVQFTIESLNGSLNGVITKGSITAADFGITFSVNFNANDKIHWTAYL